MDINKNHPFLNLVRLKNVVDFEHNREGAFSPSQPQELKNKTQKYAVFILVGSCEPATSANAQETAVLFN
ncbi:hypothetical protein [Paenisporosarcina indica]|uniref:hypothetical protein n=1 Tax=Paenisporosarcina indica TaxID=650093 RepID=UPI001470CA36|nr:hypothetical protein [Paenisporosarcina indica]